MKKGSMLLAASLLVVALAAAWRGSTMLSSAAPAATTFDYLPAIIKPPLDFAIASVEASQATQKTDNTVPLVAGKNTVVRVFAQTLNGSSPGNVTVSLSASRGGAPLGTLNDGPMAVPASPDRASFGSTFNFLLPAAWLSGNVLVTATVDSAGAVTESNESNNAFQTTLAFNVVPDLNVKIVPINYTHQGSTNPGFYPGQAIDNISDWIRRTYPVANVAISYRAPYAFTGNLDLGSEWGRILDEVTALKSVDPSPSSQVYYALVPISNGSQQWFSSGIAGIGWVCCTRASVGLNLGAGDDSGILAAHEIGHNLRRSHAPCGVSSSDPGYPYLGASIGEYGMDIQGSIATLLSPSTYVDMMSYCSPEWVSDYTYNGLYGDQIVRGLMVLDAPVSGLMIRATFDASGTPQLRPVYAFPQVVTPPAAVPDYVVQLLDDAGAVIASHGVSLHLAAEPGVSVRAIHAGVPMPARPVARVRLVQAGVTVAERRLNLDTSPAPNLSLSRGPGSLRLEWNPVGAPALIRYFADDGDGWTTLGVDVPGGSFELDPKDLPAGNGRFEVILGDSADPGNASILSAPFALDSP